MYCNSFLTVTSLQSDCFWFSLSTLFVAGFSYMGLAFWFQFAEFSPRIDSRRGGSSSGGGSGCSFSNSGSNRASSSRSQQ